MKRIITLAAMMAVLVSCGGNDGNRNGNATMQQDFMTLATERYSVRKFASTVVEQEKIDRIIEAGKIAPTAINSQPQMIYVVRSGEMMARMNEVSPCIYGAPHCFVFCYNDDNVCRRGENGNYGDIDVTIVMTHMLLQAQELGVGTCIVGRFDPEKLSEALSLPTNIHPVLMMPFGYAAEDCVPSPRHSEYRPLEETVKYL